MKKCFTITALFFLLFFNLQGQVKNSNNISPFLSSSVFCPAEIKKFFKNYPDLKYTASYDLKVKDWKISIEADLYFDRTAKPKDKKSAEFYWAGGRLLPEEELANKEKYWILQYKYENELRDPKSYTEEEVEKLKEFGSSENRKSAGGSPMFFFDFLYSAQSRVIIEDHIIKSTFLGKKTRIHERIYTPIKNVEKKILAEKEDPEIKNFIENLRSADAFYWREIAGTPRKSFHSYGIAIDLLPKKLGGKSIFWGWEKDRVGDSWMFIPLEKRWIPPKKVIEIFEKEGFIWGGYWVIYDNMHFEYHPELIKS